MCGIYTGTVTSQDRVRQLNPKRSKLIWSRRASPDPVLSCSHPWEIVITVLSGWEGWSSTPLSINSILFSSVLFVKCFEHCHKVVFQPCVPSLHPAVLIFSTAARPRMGCCFYTQFYKQEKNIIYVTIRTPRSVYFSSISRDRSGRTTLSLLHVGLLAHIDLDIHSC